jgi:hypothetical protein
VKGAIVAPDRVSVLVYRSETGAEMHRGVQPSCFFSRATRPGIERGKPAALCRAWMRTRPEKTRGAVKSIDYKIDY